MTPLKEIVASCGKSYKELADNIGNFFHFNITAADLNHFTHRRFKKIGIAQRTIIRGYFQGIGWLPKPVPRPRHQCPTCGAVHVIKSQKKSGSVQHTQKAERAIE
jgi:hypothetical protein